MTELLYFRGLFSVWLLDNSWFLKERHCEMSPCGMDWRTDGQLSKTNGTRYEWSGPRYAMVTAERWTAAWRRATWSLCLNGVAERESEAGRPVVECSVAAMCSCSGTARPWLALLLGRRRDAGGTDDAVQRHSAASQRLRRVCLTTSSSCSRRRANVSVQHTDVVVIGSLSCLLASCLVSCLPASCCVFCVDCNASTCAVI